MAILDHMHIRTFIRYLAAFLILTNTVAGSAHAAFFDPILMVLEHTDNGKPVKTKVVAKAGQTISPLRGKALEKIRILPGNPLAISQRPDDIAVELHHGSGIEAGILCSINIRYFRDARGLWVPHFQLIEEALVTRGPDGRWRPLSMARGAPSLIVMTGTSLPNPDGFYPMLEFGLTSGMLQVDSWTIR